MPGTAPCARVPPLDPVPGLLFLAPWRAGVAVVVDGTDVSGFARALQQFPIRTGTTVPDYGTSCSAP